MRIFIFKENLNVRICPHLYILSILTGVCFMIDSKTALLEGLEIDQYLWGILNTLSSNSSSASDAEEVTIDSAANWRPVNLKLMGATVKTEEDSGQETSCHGSKRAKVMSPGSVTLPTMPNWDLGQSLSPFCPPDMNSK